MAVSSVQSLKDVNDLAAMFGWHRRTVLAKVRGGEIPCVRLGTRSIRFRDEDIQRYLEANAVKAGTERREQDP